MWGGWQGSTPPPAPTHGPDQLSSVASEQRAQGMQELALQGRRPGDPGAEASQHVLASRRGQTGVEGACGGRWDWVTEGLWDYYKGFGFYSARAEEPLSRRVTCSDK